MSAIYKKAGIQFCADIVAHLEGVQCAQDTNELAYSLEQTLYLLFDFELCLLCGARAERIMTKAATLYEPIIEDPLFQLHSRKSDMYGLGTEKFFS